MLLVLSEREEAVQQWPAIWRAGNLGLTEEHASISIEDASHVQEKFMMRLRHADSRPRAGSTLRGNGSRVVKRSAQAAFVDIKQGCYSLTTLFLYRRIISPTLSTLPGNFQCE